MVEACASRVKELTSIIGTWSFTYTRTQPVQKGQQHWLWRSCKPYLRAGSGVNFSMRGVSQ